MSYDAGTAELSRRLAANGDGPAVQISGELSLSAQLSQLVETLTRREARRAEREQLEAQSVVPIDIPPVDYVVTGGQPKFKTSVRATANDASPQEGYIWFVTRLSLAGMTAGDVVNLYMPAGVNLFPNSTGLHTFTCPAGVGAGLGIADWEPGSLGLIMHSDDVFTLQSAGTLTATELILNGHAIQVTVPYLARYLL